ARGDGFGGGDVGPVAGVGERSFGVGEQLAAKRGGGEMLASGGVVAEGAVAQPAVEGGLGHDRCGVQLGVDAAQGGQCRVELAEPGLGDGAEQGGGGVDDVV